MKELRKRYEEIVKEYINIFEEKQKLEFDYWIRDIVGEVAEFGDYYFNFSDILYDINTEQPSDLIISWYDDCLENERFINYYSYCKGLRHKDIKNEK